MTEWFYKATPTKVPFAETRALAIDEWFLCRPAYEENASRADNTQYVKIGDILHVYFVGDGRKDVIGSFEIIEATQHPTPARFGKRVDGTALFEIADATFESKLRAIKGDTGYSLDPVLKKITGWVLLRRTDIVTPPYEEASASFSSQATLVRKR